MTALAAATSEAGPLEFSYQYCIFGGTTISHASHDARVQPRAAQGFKVSESVDRLAPSGGCNAMLWGIWSRFSFARKTVDTYRLLRYIHTSTERH